MGTVTTDGSSNLPSANKPENTWELVCINYQRTKINCQGTKILRKKLKMLEIQYRLF